MGNHRKLLWEIIAFYLGSNTDLKQELETRKYFSHEVCRYLSATKLIYIGKYE